MVEVVVYDKRNILKFLHTMPSVGHMTSFRDVIYSFLSNFTIANCRFKPFNLVLTASEIVEVVQWDKGNILKKGFCIPCPVLDI